VARAKKKTVSAKPSLASQTFAIATRHYANPGKDFLPAGHKFDLTYRAQNATQIDRLAAVTDIHPIAKEGKLLSGFFSSIKQSTLARAAGLLFAVGIGWVTIQSFGDDVLHIEDELGKNALNAEQGHHEKNISLRLMRKKHKVGEITVIQGSKVKIVRAKHGDAFVVNNGPFTAKVRFPKGAKNDVHLKLNEQGTLMPIGTPEFAIEVIKGDVQIAEIDDDDDFEHYKAGEKAIFSLSPEDRESL